MTVRACYSGDPLCTGVHPCDGCLTAIVQVVLPWSLAAVGMVSREMAIQSWEPGEVQDQIRMVLETTHPGGLLSQEVIHAWMKEYMAKMLVVQTEALRLATPSAPSVPDAQAHPTTGGGSRYAPGPIVKSQASAPAPIQPPTPAPEVIPIVGTTQVMHDPLDEPASLSDVLDAIDLPLVSPKASKKKNNGKKDEESNQ